MSPGTKVAVLLCLTVPSPASAHVGSAAPTHWPTVPAGRPALSAPAPSTAPALGRAVPQDATRPVSADAALDTLRLTLADAVSAALSSNPAYRRAENDLRLNPVETRATWMTQLLPDLSLSLLNTNFYGNVQRTATDNFGDPIARPDAQWTFFSGTSQSVGLNWSTRGLSIIHDHRSQSLVNRGREVAADRAATDLRVQVERLYLDVLEQRASLESEAELVEARVFDLDVANRLYALALRSRVDVLQAELAVEQQRATLRRSRGAYDQALLQLRSTLGQDDGRPVTLADEPFAAFDPSQLDSDELVDRALAGSIQMRELEIALDQSELGLSRMGNSWWPVLSLTGNIYRRSQNRNQDALFDFTYDEDLDYSFGASLSFPVLNSFFQDRSNATSAAVQLDNQRETERETRLEIERAVRSARLDLGNQWDALQLEEAALTIAGDALALARDEYRLGTRTFSELRTSIEAEANARRNVIAARFAFRDALLSLEEAVGARLRPETPGGN